MNRITIRASLILYATLLFWVVTIIWAIFAELEEVIKGNGSVIASSKTQIIQNLEGGIIREIYIETGDIVESNQPLIRIDTTKFESELSSLEQELSAAEKKLDLLNEEKEILQPLVEKGVEAKIGLIRLLQNISESETNILKLQQKTIIVKDKLERALVKSPLDGVINRLFVNTLGGVIQPGETLMEIVPIGDDLLIEVEINPKDIALIRTGQKAIIKLSAYDFARFGSISGKVLTISADSMKNEDGIILYLCQISIKQSAITSLGINIEILPGMLAQVDIVNGQRSVMDYLLEPVFKVTNEAFREK